MAGKYQFTVTLTVRECANGSLGPLPFLIQTPALKKAITDNINYQRMCKGTLFLHYLPFGLCHFASDWLMYASFTLCKRNPLVSLSPAMLRRSLDTSAFSLLKPQPQSAPGSKWLVGISHFRPDWSAEKSRFPQKCSCQQQRWDKTKPYVVLKGVLWFQFVLVAKEFISIFIPEYPTL